MKVLMLGWELAPFIKGGLGVAIAGLAEALAKLGHRLTLVLPYKLPISSPHFEVVFVGDRPSHDEFYKNYASADIMVAKLDESTKIFKIHSILDEAYLYAKRLKVLLKDLDYDVVHAHDWLTMPAGCIAQNARQPLVTHIHSTEFYRTGGRNYNSEVYNIEYQGLHAAKKVIAISEHVRRVIVNNYHVDSSSITTVHNGINAYAWRTDTSGLETLKQHHNLVVFVGRLTIQKGVDYLLQAARLVYEQRPRTLFVVIGDGDMKEQLINQSINERLTSNVIFTGWLSQEEALKYYAAADLFVMPSVAEPFGLVALEAALCDTPVIMSKTCGVGDVFKHCLQADFWDVKRLASHIMAVLEHKKLKAELVSNGHRNALDITWAKAAQKVETIYRELIP